MSEFGPKHFINRELSWLEFNQRVLDEALNRRNPLLERVKFFCIVSSNLDEFFEVRVAGIKQQIESGVVERSIDGMTSTETFLAVHRRVLRMVEEQYACWREQLVPELAVNGIRFRSFAELSPEELEWVGKYYHEQVRPVLTPLAIDPSHPFPHLLNKSLNTIVQVELEKGGELVRQLGVVQVPRVLPRLVRLPHKDTLRDYVFMGEMIDHFLADIFPGTKILGFWKIRVTRNSELYIDADDLGNLLKAVEKELHNRRKGAAVRLEVEAGCPADIRSMLRTTLGLLDEDVYAINGPLNPTRLMAVCEGDHSPELRDPPFMPAVSPRFRGELDFFAAIRRGDILLHHPYESFGSVVELVEKAAQDPNVLAIKQTLYRTGGDTRIVGALMNAVNNGKQVTVVVELRARFDEANNIQWARRLEEAGVHVVYGLVGYKIHAKLLMIVRKEDQRIERYVHVATGNYNATTARFYTDLCVMTCRKEVGEDVTNLFNLLTGVCQFQPTLRFLVAPFEMHRRIVELIEREIANARQGLPTRIIAKMNALVDAEVIAALYRASQAGVKIDLVVRGVCCLRPGVPGVSENITVRSIIDRFLEHSRIFYVENGCRPEVYIGSADWMPRNLFGRIEVLLSVEDGNLRERVVSEVLAVTLADNEKARLLQPDGSYVLPTLKKGVAPRRSQREFIALAASESDKPRQQAMRAPRVKVKREAPRE